MDEWLGAFLRELRLNRRQSMEQVAGAAGISGRTLRRWEQGTVLPRRRELAQVLDALETTQQARLHAFAFLGARRGTEALQALAPTVLPSEAALPKPGDLWRAMRRRSNLSGARVASQLQISSSTVSRWEASLARPLSHQAEALFALYHATEEEREVLTRQLSRLGVQAGGLLPPLDRCEAELANLLIQVDREVPLSGDLRFLLLQAALWSHAMKRPSVLPLLAQAYAGYAEWLLRRGRFREMGAPAHRTIAIVSDPNLAGVDRLLALGIAAKYADEGVGKSDPRKAYQVLAAKVPLARELNNATHVFAEMAGYALSARQPSHAQALSDLASRTAAQIGHPNAVQHARKMRARILLGVGRAAEALALLEVEETTCPNQRIFSAFQWAETLLTVGSRTEAGEWLHRAEALIATHDLAHLQGHLDRIGRQL